MLSHAPYRHNLYIPCLDNPIICLSRLVLARCLPFHCPLQEVSSSWGCAFQTNTDQPIQSVHPSSLPLLGSQSLGPYGKPSLVTPGPDNQRQLLCPRAHCSYSDQPILSLFTLSCLFIPLQTMVKIFLPPVTLPACYQPWFLSYVVLCGMPFPRGNYFQWQSSPDPLALLYLKISINSIF